MGVDNGSEMQNLASSSSHNSLPQASPANRENGMIETSSGGSGKDSTPGATNHVIPPTSYARGPTLRGASDLVSGSSAASNSSSQSHRAVHGKQNHQNEFSGSYTSPQIASNIAMMDESKISFVEPI